MSYEGGDAEGNISNSWEPGILGIPNCPVVGEENEYKFRKTDGSDFNTFSIVMIKSLLLTLDYISHVELLEPIHGK